MTPTPLPRRDRALAIAQGRTLVTGDPATVSWLTGLVPDIEWGPSPFSAPSLAIVRSDGSVRAVVSEDEAGGLPGDVEPLVFPGFAIEDVDRPGASLEQALAALPREGALAVELASLPGSLVRALGSRQLDDVSSELQQARSVKDADELAAIRVSIAVADAGQAAARRALAAGRTELMLWTETRAAMETAAGERIPVLADFVTGPRTANAGGPPNERRLEETDLLLVDLVPRVGAYWGDSCATVALGEPAEPVRQAHAVALEALEAAKAMIRPGTRAGDVDEVVRSMIASAGGSYPHHTGHGLGLTVHEEPRIVPGSDRVLQAGMVVALEPGWYQDDWGVRVEQILLVTEDGHEVLSGHDLAL
jgi:Xaa-Pro aminopeptidase